MLLNQHPPLARYSAAQVADWLHSYLDTFSVLDLLQEVAEAVHTRSCDPDDGFADAAKRIEALVFVLMCDPNTRQLKKVN